MIGKSGALFFCFIALIYFSWDQKRKLAIWSQLGHEVISLQAPKKAESLLQLPAIEALFGDLWECKSTGQTDRRVISATVVLNWEGAFDILKTLFSHESEPRDWQLKSWQVNAMKTDAARCQLNLTLEKPEGL